MHVHISLLNWDLSENLGLAERLGEVNPVPFIIMVIIIRLGGTGWEVGPSENCPRGRERWTLMPLRGFVQLNVTGSQ